MIKQFLVGGFDDNFSYLITDTSSTKVAVVDPAGDLSELISFVESESLTITSILITHSHFDHIEGIPDILKKWNATLFVHTNAKKHINRMPEKNSFIEEGDILKIGKIEINVMHTPGHIDDSVCFYIEAGINDSDPALITGDTLFVEGCGRTNKTDAEDLYKSLERLKKLEPSTKVYTGHNYGSIPISTIEHELKNNHFFLARDYEAFLKKRFPE